MELHETLYDLGLRAGPAVFADPDRLRAALAQLPPGSVDPDDVELLVDAVRLGALRHLTGTLDQGGPTGPAIDTAGDVLARVRGSADADGARWAVAALGHAVGRVPAADVRRHAGGRTGPTLPPPPASPPPRASTPPAGPPPSWAPPPPPHPQPQPQASWPGPGPVAPVARRSPLPWILLGVAALVLVAVLGTVLAVVLTGDDDTERASDPVPSSAPATSATPDPDAPTPPTSTATPEPPPTLPPGAIVGDGYAFTRPDEWTDVTEDVTGEQGGQATDLAIAWGETFQGSRANLIVESGFAGGETDPDVIRPTWESNMVGATGARPEDTGDTTIDGERAVSVRISRTNEFGVDIEQRGYLTIHDGDLYSIILSTQAGDQRAQDAMADVLASWTWQS